MSQSSTENQGVKRIHPLFPTRSEVADNPDIAYSDHLAVLAHVPVGNKQLNLLSWNVLGPNAKSGIHYRPNNSNEEWETQEQLDQRLTRIAKAIVEMVKVNKVHVICLQEAPNELVAKLSALINKKELPMQAPVASGTGSITLIHNDIEMQSEKFKRGASFLGVDMQNVQSFELKFNGHAVLLHNVHSQYYDTPNYHEGFYSELLHNEDKDVSIVIGDTNTHVAPINSSSRNIITGAVPWVANSIYNIDQSIQLSDFPDACFYRDEKDKKIKQVDIQVVDHHSGNPLQLADGGSLNPNKETLWRICIDLDTDSQNKKFIDDFTLRDIEAEIKNECALLSQDNGFMIRPAAKDDNSRGIAIVCANRSIVDAVLKVEAKHIDCDEIDRQRLESLPNGLSPAVFFIPENRQQQLLKMLMVRNTIVKLLRERLEKLSENNPLMAKSDNKYNILFELYESLTNTDNIKPLLESFLEWSKKDFNGQTYIDYLNNPRSLTQKAMRLFKSNEQSQTSSAELLNEINVLLGEYGKAERETKEQNITPLKN